MTEKTPKLMTVYRIDRIPGRKLAPVDPEIGQPIEVPVELAEFLIARGDFGLTPPAPPATPAELAPAPAEPFDVLEIRHLPASEEE